MGGFSRWVLPRVLPEYLRYSLSIIAQSAIITPNFVAPKVPRNIAINVMCKITYVITVPKSKLRKFHNPTRGPPPF